MKWIRRNIEHIKFIDDWPGVYVMYNDEDNIIYIGHSKQLGKRIKSHEKSGEYAYIKQKYTPSIDDAQKLESRLIQRLKPTLNRDFKTEVESELQITLNLKVREDLHRALKIYCAGNDVKIPEGAYTILREGLEEELNYLKGYENG
jgi:excinuclease UvrABC nuclease subunit